MNGPLKQAWDTVPAEAKKLNPDLTPDDREIRVVLRDYMKSGNGRIQIPPEVEATPTKRLLPTKDQDYPVVVVDVDPPVNHTIRDPGSDGSRAVGPSR